MSEHLSQFLTLPSLMAACIALSVGYLVTRFRSPQTYVALISVAFVTSAILVFSWISGMIFGPSLEAKDGHGGIELIRLEDRLGFLWIGGVMTTYGVGMLIGHVRRHTRSEASA